MEAVLGDQIAKAVSSDKPTEVHRVGGRQGICTEEGNYWANGSGTPEKTFDDVIRPGEIEGLTFDEESGQFLLLYNRGTIIYAGMPTAFMMVPTRKYTKFTCMICLGDELYHTAF